MAKVWEMIRRGTLDVVSSDHCGFSMGGEHGKASSGRDASFDAIPNGIPGLAARLPILFSGGRVEGADHARRFRPAERDQPGPADGAGAAEGDDRDRRRCRPGAVGPEEEGHLTNTLMQHAIDYTPYEGLEVTGWPVATVRRGTVVMRDGVVQAEPGTGQFLPRGPYAMATPRGVLANGFDAAPPPA